MKKDVTFEEICIYLEKYCGQLTAIQKHILKVKYHPEGRILGVGRKFGGGGYTYYPLVEDTTGRLMVVRGDGHTDFSVIEGRFAYPVGPPKYWISGKGVIGG